MPYIQSPVLFCVSVPINSAPQTLFVTLWIHKPFFFFAESVTVCHGGHRTRRKQTPHDLQTKLLYTEAKP